MHWLSQNYQWLFDGVGGAVVIALIGFGYRRWKKSPNYPAPSSTLTAQGAKVANSPVASGAGITQNVNSPTVHIHLAQTAARPTLNVEIREVCFDDVLDSVTEDLADFTVERYIFVRLWLVNTENVATGVKEWKLTYSKDGKTQVASEVEDFSKWHQHVKWKERTAILNMDVIKEARKPMTSFPSHSLEQGVPSQGWVCFKATGVNGMGGDDGKIELRVVDSFDQEFRVESPAPLACKGTIVNPELPW